jgi:hypothetical protein
MTEALSPEIVVAVGVCGRIAAAVGTGTLPILPGGSFRIRVALVFALAVVAGATFLAWLIAKSLRVPDMWGRIAAVLVALAAGSTICWLGWPPPSTGSSSFPFPLWRPIAEVWRRLLQMACVLWLECA